MSTQKAKGTRAEVAVRDYLNNNTDWQWHRPAPAGKNDKGDVCTDLSVVIEVKDCARMELAQWVDEAEQEAINANYAYVYAVWHKRKRKGNPGEWYVSMPGSVFVFLLNRAFA